MQIKQYVITHNIFFYILFYCILFSDIVSVQPDITQTVVPQTYVTIQNPNAMDTPNNNHIGSMEKVPILSEHQSSLLDSSSKSSEHLSVNGSKISLKNVSDSDNRADSAYSDRTNRHSTISCQLPSNIDMESLVWANVTHAGGRITLPESGMWQVVLIF